MNKSDRQYLHYLEDIILAMKGFNLEDFLNVLQVVAVLEIAGKILTSGNIENLYAAAELLVANT